jgi:hypothetical protein
LKRILIKRRKFSRSITTALRGGGVEYSSPSSVTVLTLAANGTRVAILADSDDAGCDEDWLMLSAAGYLVISSSLEDDGCWQFSFLSLKSRGPCALSDKDDATGELDDGGMV